MGIGRAAALRCAEAGGKVVIADIDKIGLKETEAAIQSKNGQVVSLEIDISDANQVEELMVNTLKTFGQIDGLINCAGVLEGAYVPIDELKESIWNQVMDVNLKGSFLASKYVSAIMKKQGKGVIILLSSGAGVKGGSSSIAYGTSKGGVHGLAMVLESQLTSFGIRVHAICPGGISTPMKLKNIADGAEAEGKSVDEALKLASDNLGSPEGVGDILAFLVSDQAAHLRQTIFTR